MPGPKYGEFQFPSSFGFTGSASDAPTQTVKSYERSRPRFAEGGKVDTKKSDPKTPAKPLPNPKPEPRISALDALKGKGRRAAEKELGLKKGGKAKYARGGGVDSERGLVDRSEPSNQVDQVSGGKTPLRPGFKRGGVKKALGGPVKAKSGGGATAVVARALSKHVAAPKPKGHGVKSGAKARGGRAC